MAPEMSCEGIFQALEIRIDGYVVAVLVDANVLSEAMKPSPNSRVLNWLVAHEPRIVIDPIILGEIRIGVLALPKGRRRKNLEHWFEEGVRSFVCLPWNSDVALCWAALVADLARAGKMMALKDSMIAATAIFHELTVATRNRRDFENAGLDVVNPFE